MTVISVVRQMQVPLLALILLGACLAKVSAMLRARSVLAALDATSLFPPRLRRPAGLALCLTELSLGAGLLVTAGPSGQGRADAVRLATGLFFLLATAAVVELREFRSGLGCGCFGDLSGQPPGPRSVARPALLAVAALVSVHSGALAPPPGPATAGGVGILVAEVGLLAVLSPEVGELLDRLGYSEPCGLRPVPPQRALASLRRSRAWRHHAGLLTQSAHTDMWRELCWWYLVYPGRDGTGDCDVVFAVEVRARRPEVHAAVVPRARRNPADGMPAAPRADGLSPAF